MARNEVRRRFAVVWGITALIFYGLKFGLRFKIWDWKNRLLIPGPRSEKPVAEIAQLKKPTFNQMVDFDDCRIVFETCKDSDLSAAWTVKLKSWWWSSVTLRPDEWQSSLNFYCGIKFG